jgi:hypothetical protein
MELEKVIHRMATDLLFAKHVHADPEAALKEEKFTLSSDEMSALRSVLDKLGSIDPAKLGSAQLADWYKAQLADWYKAQLADWYKI